MSDSADALREHEAKYRAVFDAMDQGFCILEMLFDADERPVDYRFLEANPAFAQQTGLVDAVGRTARDVVPNLESHWLETYGRVAMTGEPARFQSGSDAMHRWFDVFAFRVGDPAARRVALLFTDVSAARLADAERERLLAEVRAERAGLHALIVSMPAPVAMLVGPTHRHAIVNDAFKRISGGGRDVTGLTVREAFPELEGQGIYERFDHVYATGEPWFAPEQLVRFDRDGTGVMDTWFDVRFEPVRDGEVRVTGILNFAVDVTAQVRARREIEGLLADSESARREAESARTRAEAVLASIGDAFYLLDRDWRFTYVNDAAEPLLQTTRDELVGRSLWEAFPGVIGSVFEGPYREAMESGRVTSAEAFFEPLDSWFDVRTYPWAGGLMVHFRDVGQRKAADTERERLLADAEASRRSAEDAADRLARLHRVSAALGRAVTPEALAEAVVREGTPAVGAQVGVVTRLSSDAREFHLVASHGLPTYAAAQWARFPNARPSPHAEALAARVPLFIESPDEYLRRFPELGELRAAAAAGSTAALPLLVGGEPFGVLSFGFAEARTFSAEDREFLGTVASQCAQALERARLFEAERVARQEAEAANRAKSDFLAVMSHELRTPLNAIGGYAELLEMGIRGPVTPQQAEDLRRVQASQRHLLGLVNEVLNYARIETGTVHYQLADVPLADVVAAVEPLVAPQLAAKQLAFTFEACDATIVARADQEKTRQVLLNLLSNAIKFTPAGGRVDIRCLIDRERDRALVQVRDTGIGIAPEELERVFEPFVQVNASLTRTHEGAGLGLAISRDLARGMGGDLTAESVPGRGSTFTLALPRP